MGKTIEEYLEEFDNARLGEDVKQGLINCIKKCYEDATGHPDSVAALAELAEETKRRIDALLLIPGSTTADGALEDIKVMSEEVGGGVEKTPGGAVREQIARLKRLIANDCITRSELKSGKKWKDDRTYLRTGRIDPATGAGGGTIYGMISSGFMESGIDLSIDLTSDSVRCKRFLYNQDGSFRGTVVDMTVDDFPFEIPDSKYKYRFAFYPADKEYGTVITEEEALDLVNYIRFTSGGSEVLATNEEIKKLMEKTENALASADFEEIFGVKMFTAWNWGKAINLNAESCDINLPYDTADYSYILIPCNEGEIYTITGKGGTGARLYGCVAADGKTIIKVAPAGINREAYGLEIPAGAEWLVVNTKNSERRIVYKGTIARKTSQNAALQENGLHLVAHRGLDDGAHEGTIRAFEDACKTGMYAVNTAQIRKSADGTLWIFHDENVDAQTDGKGEFGELSDSYISSLHYIGAGSDADRRIPTVEDVLKMCHKHGTVPMLRFASGSSGAIAVSDVETWEALFRMIEFYNFKTIMFNGSLEQLKMLDKRYPASIKCYWHTGTTTVDQMVTLLDSVPWIDKRTVYAMLARNDCSHTEVEKLRKAGYGLYISTTGDSIEGLADLGATFAHVNHYPGLPKDGEEYVPTAMQLACEISKMKGEL